MSDEQQHRMLPGSHERPTGPECRCGAEWDYWNDMCVTLESEDLTSKRSS